MAWEIEVEGLGLIEGDGDAPSEAQLASLRRAQAQARQQNLVGPSAEVGPPRERSSIPTHENLGLLGRTPLPGGVDIRFNPHVPTEEEWRGVAVGMGATAGGLVGGVTGTPLAVAGGSTLGAAGASLAADAIGLDRSASVSEGLERAGWEGAATVAGAVLPGALAAGGRRVKNAVLALEPQVAALGRRFGIRQGIENVSRNPLVAGFRRTFGQLPLAGRRFVEASEEAAQNVDDAVGREAARVGAPRSLALGDQARTGRLAYRSGVANFDAARERASALYETALPAARAADVRVPSNAARDAMRRIGGEVRSRRIPTTWEGPSERIAGAEYIPPSGPPGPMPSGATPIGPGSAPAVRNPLSPSFPAADVADETIDVAARSAPVGTNRTTATRDTPTARFVRRWQDLGRAEDGTLSIDEHLSFVRELDDEIAKVKRAGRNRAVRELVQLRDAARADLRNATGPPEVVAQLRDADAAYQAAQELVENPVGRVFSRVDRRAFRVGHEEPGTLNESQFANELFKPGSPALADAQGVRQTRALIGDRAFRVGYQQKLEDTLRRAVQVERGATGDVTGVVSVSDDALAELGLFQGPGNARRQATEEALRGTGQTVERLEEFIGLVRRVAEFKPPNTSQYLTRRLALTGAGGAVGAAAIYGAGANAIGPAALALLGTRGMGRLLTNPQRLSSAIAALNRATAPTATEAMRASALAQIAKLATMGSVDGSGEPEPEPRAPAPVAPPLRPSMPLSPVTP